MDAPERLPRGPLIADAGPGDVADLGDEDSDLADEDADLDEASVVGAPLPMAFDGLDPLEDTGFEGAEFEDATLESNALPVQLLANDTMAQIAKSPWLPPLVAIGALAVVALLLFIVLGVGWRVGDSAVEATAQPPARVAPAAAVEGAPDATPTRQSTSGGDGSAAPTASERSSVTPPASPSLNAAPAVVPREAPAAAAPMPASIAAGPLPTPASPPTSTARPAQAPEVTRVRARSAAAPPQATVRPAGDGDVRTVLAPWGQGDEPVAEPSPAEESANTDAAEDGDDGTPLWGTAE